MTPRLFVSALFLLSHLICYWNYGVRAGKVPDASSTLLRMHRLYTRQPPHDTTLYDILEVSSNATAAQITKSYRKLSRKYHPDKQRRKSRPSNSNDDEEDQAEHEQQLERIREAYEVLKVDSTRLPYHRFGLVDTVHAVFLLTGRFEDAVGRDPNLTELLHLMGYSLDKSPPPPPLIHSENPRATGRASVGDEFRHKQEHNRRVNFIAANIVGMIRPLVEESVDEAFLADLVVTQCDRLKKLPMGAQIIRCIGRAYRYAGRRVLRQYHANPKRFGIEKKGHRFPKSNFITNPAFVSISDGLRDHLRNAEHVVQAAFATGKMMISKSGVDKQPHRGEDGAFIPQDNELGELPETLLHDTESVEGLAGFLPPEEDEMRRDERARAQKAIVESLQVDALWKISKIDLDRTVREACNMVLEGSMFFGQQEGWVGSNGLVISSNVARIRAAAALVMIGEIMVQRSKEGTAWME